MSLLSSPALLAHARVLLSLWSTCPPLYLPAPTYPSALLLYRSVTATSTTLRSVYAVTSAFFLSTSLVMASVAVVATA